jgi:hypothetical protein
MDSLEIDATITAVLGHPAAELARAFQDPGFGSQPQPAGGPPPAAWADLVALHRTNRSLWKVEDAAHADGISDEALGALKRQIDVLNLRRNQLIEAIDQVFRRMLPASPISAAPQLHDSPGLILDRMSIESLRADVLRAEAKHQSRASGSPGLLAIEQDIDALVSRLREIIGAVISGRRRLRPTPRTKVHRPPNAANTPRL